SPSLGAIGAHVWKPQSNDGMAPPMGDSAVDQVPAAPRRPLAAVVLAAGKGTRMKSALHKVLHPIAGRPMIEHLLASLAELAPERTVIVVGDLREQLERRLSGRAEF